jgi:hypothetical protein
MNVSLSFNMNVSLSFSPSCFGIQYPEVALFPLLPAIPFSSLCSVKRCNQYLFDCHILHAFAAGQSYPNSRVAVHT